MQTFQKVGKNVKAGKSNNNQNKLKFFYFKCTHPKENGVKCVINLRLLFVTLAATATSEQSTLSGGKAPTSRKNKTEIHSSKL